MDTGASAKPGLHSTPAAKAAYHKTFSKAHAKVTARASQPAGSELALTVGLTLNGDGTTCGTDTSLVVNVGDTIDFCYTVTNNSSTNLAYSTLTDSVAGTIFTNQPTAIPAGGGTYTYHRSVTASASATFDETWTAQDLLPGYTPDDTATTAFVDISASGTPLTLGDDDATTITLPFDFTFYGATSNQICVGNNGGLLFAPTNCSLTYGNQALPQSFGGAAILPLWDDLYAAPGGVYWAAQGSGADQSVIIQWNKPHFDANASGFASPGQSNFEAVLRQDGTIAFVYDELSYSEPADPEWDNAGDATIGLQNADGTLVNQYSFNTVLPHLPPSAIEWTSGDATVLTAEASVSLDVGAPVIDLSPTSISETSPSGSSTPVTAPLTIGNTGDRDLTWNIGEAPSSRAHFPRTRRPVLHKYEYDQTVAAAQPRTAEMAAKQALLGARKPHAGPLGTSGVPAYSFSGWTHTDFLSLDLTDPSALTSIVDPQPANVYAAAFVGGDLTKLYVITDAAEFGTVDPATGAYTAIGPVSGAAAGTTFVSMKWDPVTGNTYAAGNGATGNTLYTIDVTTGAATAVGAITGPDVSPTAIVINIAISPDGLMYGVEIADDVLLAIDKTTGEAAVIGPTGVAANFAQGADFDPTTGILYWDGYQGSGVSSIYTLDLASGQATEVGPVADGAELFGLAVAIAGGGCAQPEDVPWLSVDPASGTVAVGAPAQTATATLDPTGLADGYYTANICVNSNDPAHRTIAVPVDFTVGNVTPAVTVAPTSLSFSLETGTGSDTLTITNEGSPGSHLTYTITEAEADCATPSDVPWLSEAPTSGDVTTTTPGSVAVTVDTTGLETGDHTASLCIATNDPANPTVTVPVTLTVTPQDEIFKDGFDGAGNPNVITGTINQPVEPTFDGNSFDFALGDYHPYDASITTDDINLYSLDGVSIAVYWYGDAVPPEVEDLVGGVVSTPGGADFAVLQSGDTIGPDSPVSATSQGADMSAFDVGVDGYIGVAFYNETTSAVNYGYLHVTTSPGGFPVQVIDYGYDNSGAAITIP